MKKRIKIAIAAALLGTISFSGIVVRAGSWDNLKLRYFHLTKYLNDREGEFNDLRAQSINQDTNLEKYTRIELSQLLDGGPPKDGIPSIDNPKFDTAKTTSFPASEMVIGIEINGEAVAYPFGIMNWHEIVNDTVGGVKVAVSYCPLCDTIVAFDRANTTYGVSGKLYQSCLVMYDRADDTLYSQPWALGIIGAKVNRSLDKIPAIKTTLGAWLEEHPNSKILSADTGHNRDYYSYPYGSYYTDNRLVFPARNQEKRELHPKKIISYVWSGNGATPHNNFSGESVQFVHSEIEKIGEKIVVFDGREIRGRWDEKLKTVIVEELDGTQIPSSTAFAFVYPAFFGLEN
ncbi:MAG: DUF3179 domain-containing protein [Cyanobacteriota bacterium]|nr:DUF3179 domain-containing protein [Cyanobacteriota bacterium]